MCPCLPSVRLRFVRGSLLLEPAERCTQDCVSAHDALHALVAPLPDVLWDRRVQRWRAPAWRYPELLDALRGASRASLGSGEPIDEVAARSLGVFDTDARARWSPPSLRPYQDAALIAWELAGRRGIVALPTGSGKTRTAIAAMAQTGASTLCLVPTRVLLHQWRDELARWYTGPIGAWGDGARDHQRISVATFESAFRHMDRIGADFSLLVIDEVHHFGVGVRDEALEMSVAPMRLGLSATPPSNAAARARLDWLVGPTVHELSVADLAGTFLADFDIVVMRLALNPVERARYASDTETFRKAFAAYRQRNPCGGWERFVAEASRSYEGRVAVGAWREAHRLCAFNAAKESAVTALLHRHRDARVLVFTADNTSAYCIARRNLVMPITCDIHKAERDDALAAFRTGELRALVSSRVLNEGLDVPDADVAIVVGSTGGEREYLQRIGRLLRPAPGKRATVYELVTLGTPEVRKAVRRRRTLGRPWREVT